MDEKSVVASLALHAVLEPIFQEVSWCEGKRMDPTLPHLTMSLLTFTKKDVDRGINAMV